jgi:hypothetical protein
MTHVYVVVEGQAEETFVNEILAPVLGLQCVFLYPRLLGRPGHKGGRVNYPRVKTDVITLLKQRTGAYCTTLLDLYGMGKGFPDPPESPDVKTLSRVARLEQGMKSDIQANLDPKFRADARFIPYIQQYEFEGLLFSDPTGLANGISQPVLKQGFQAIREKFRTPEDINDSEQTAPSKRIKAVMSSYQKPLHGLLAAKAIGLGKIRAECPRFNNWLTKLENLAEN